VGVLDNVKYLKQQAWDLGRSRGRARARYRRECGGIARPSRIRSRTVLSTEIISSNVAVGRLSNQPRVR
jgi:hypothetical protein